MRREPVQLCLYFFADIERVDKCGDAFGGHCCIGACQLLERLVGVGVAFAAQYGLDSFGHDVPHAVEVAVDGFGVEQQLAHAFECA